MPQTARFDRLSRLLSNPIGLLRHKNLFALSLVVQEEACDDLGALTSLDHLHVVINTLLGSNFSVDQPRPTNQQDLNIYIWEHLTHPDTSWHILTQCHNMTQWHSQAESLRPGSSDFLLPDAAASVLRRQEPATRIDFCHFCPDFQT